MNFKIETVPSFEDIFDENIPEMESLLKGIPTQTIIILFSTIMSEIDKNGENDDVQKKIWEALTYRFPIEVKNKILKTLFENKFLTRSKRATIFTKYYVMEFLQYLLLNYQDYDIEDTTPEDEVNIFKAYLIIIGEVQRNDSIKFEENKPNNPSPETESIDDYFQQMTWPTLLKQHSISRQINIKYEMLKGILFNQFLLNNYPDCFKTYLESYSANSFWEIFMHNLFCIQQSITNVLEINGQLLSSPILSNLTEQSIRILEPIILHLEKLESIKQNTENTKNFNDFLMIRESPIFKVKYGNESLDTYLILNPQFLKEKLFKTLVFDFYQKSGVKSEFKTLPDFLNKKAISFTEKILLKSLILYTFRGKYNKIIFDENQEEGMPDCYIRLGKYILLFELKDSLMPSKAIENRTYNEIKKDVSMKFLSNEKGKAKGIGQILNNIYKLNLSAFEFDRFDRKGIKPKNVVIIPVVIYTDYNYSMTGIQDFLRKEFSRRIDKDKVFNIKKIEDLILVDLEIFFDLIMNSLERNFLKYCFDYNLKMKKMVKQFLRNKTMENDFKTLDNFEQYLAPILNDNKEKIDFDKICGILNIEFPR